MDAGSGPRVAGIFEIQRGVRRLRGSSVTGIEFEVLQEMLLRHQETILVCMRA